MKVCERDELFAIAAATLCCTGVVFGAKCFRRKPDPEPGIYGRGERLCSDRPAVDPYRGSEPQRVPMGLPDHDFVNRAMKRSRPERSRFRIPPIRNKWCATTGRSTDLRLLAPAILRGNLPNT